MLPPLLTLPNFNKQFQSHCDANKERLGAIISQKIHPIACKSRFLDDQIKILVINEKELFPLSML